MIIKQLSVFMENREGRIQQVTEKLKENNINIASLSLADTSEYGMLRMIVSQPDKARRILKEDGFSAMLTNVIAVALPHKTGMLHTLVSALADVNIEYMYVLSTGENPAMILKISDLEEGEKVLLANGFPMLGEEAYEINN